MGFFDLRVRPLGLVSAAAALGGAATLAGFLARLWWVFDLAVHFRVQYFALEALCACILLLARRRTSAAVAGSFAALNLAVFFPLYLPQPRMPSGDSTIKAALVNVRSQNSRYGKVLEFVRSEGPDLLVLLEVNHPWLNALQDLKAAYPYTIEVPRTDDFGIALYSRLPFSKSTTHTLGAGGIPAVVAVLAVDGREITVIGAHAVPPFGCAAWRSRNDQLAELARMAGDARGERMLLGDLNVSPWSPYFRQLLKEASLRDSRTGYGLQPTWPTSFPPLLIPLDHCLTSPGISVLHRRVGPAVGSDHYPVVVEFTLSGDK